MTHRKHPLRVNRRTFIGISSKAVAASLAIPTVLRTAIADDVQPPGSSGQGMRGAAGVDRIVVQPGKTYLRGWAGYGDPPKHPHQGPEGTIKTRWTKASGPGRVTFENPEATITAATFSSPGTYLLRLAASDGTNSTSSELTVKVELPPPQQQLQVVHTRRYSIDSPLWNDRFKALIVHWIPHCVEQLERTDIEVGGLDNFMEAGKALRGEPHGPHKGFVFSDAYVHNTVEAMSIALMIDPKGDGEIIKAQDRLRATLNRWIPIILAAQEPDGYMQTAFTLPRVSNAGGDQAPGPFLRWERRSDHEGYTGGYFLESAIVHYMMTDKRDPRLYEAAKRLADCWDRNLGPAPKKAWYDGHEEMEQALVRFGRFVNDNEGAGKGDKYINLAKFLLDNRYRSARSEKERGEYDQCHLPVTEQYEAVGHAVRAMYCYSGMADVVTETHDEDYRSAVKSLWDNLVHRKYYVTGGIGGAASNEGFGPNFALGNDSYCESCSSCGMIFFQWKMGLAYHDAKFADIYEDTLYNALLGGLALNGKTFYYPNPLDARELRASWHIVPCCVGNIPRTLLQMPTWTYAKSSDAIFVNMYIGSTILVENVGGTDVEMIQRTHYPWDGKVEIVVNPKQARKRMSIHVRIPNREVSELYSTTPKVNHLLSLSINGKSIKPKIVNGYAVIARTWKPNDQIELELPLPIQRVHASDKVEADRGKVALRRGPLLYNIENVDVRDVDRAVGANAKLDSMWQPDLLNGVVAITGQFIDGSPLLAIPNFARMNREPAPPPSIAGSEETSAHDHAHMPVVSKVWINEA